MTDDNPCRRTWHWQIDALEEGPDYVFLASVEPAQVEQLHAFVRDNVPQAYVKQDVGAPPKHRADAKRYSYYLDRHSHEVLPERTAASKSIWFHGDIEIFDQHLVLRHVSAGGMFDDTAFVLALARTPLLTMQSWIIGYGGYEWAEVARGHDGDELIEYVERGPGCVADFMFEAAPRPAAGTNVDERRTVALLPSRPYDAIAFELGDFSLSISRARLTTMIARAPTNWKTEAERLTMIAGHRAKQLMAAAGRAASSSDASHLLLQLIERGQVHITHTSSGRTVRLAYIRYTGHRAGPMSGRGMITVSDRVDGAAFLHVDWWVS